MITNPVKSPQNLNGLLSGRSYGEGEWRGGGGEGEDLQSQRVLEIWCILLECPALTYLESEGAET